MHDTWLCRACELKEEGGPEPACCLCPVAGGALKPTTLPGLWCHAACMQWIPEVTCLEPMRCGRPRGAPPSPHFSCRRRSLPTPSP